MASFILLPQKVKEGVSPTAHSSTHPAVPIVSVLQVKGLQEHRRVNSGPRTTFNPTELRTAEKTSKIFSFK